MRKILGRGLAVLGTSFGIAVPAVAQPVAQTPPNVLIIVADDLGFADVGAFGSEISTPNLDALANRGVKLTRFYTMPACSPTRAALLTGRDNHRAGLGTMRETMTPELVGHPGYEGYVPPSVPTLAERMKAAGYTTIMSGKWHLGLVKGVTPADRGFEMSFALLQGAHNHYGMDQTPAYARADAAPTYTLNGQTVSWPVGSYSSDYFTDRFLEFLGQTGTDKPFFGYLTYTAPHWPLQAPKDVIAKYRGRYDAGPAALAVARVKRMEKLGIVPKSVAMRPIEDGWAKLSPQQRAEDARQMEVYAAMVDRMDQNIGRVVAALRERGQLDNTIILFLSDNGPEGMKFDSPRVPGNLLNGVESGVDNSLANMGAGNSYFSYGPLWGQAGAVPFWGTKEHTSEGGIHSPAIIAGPGIAARGVRDAQLDVLDVVPTVLEMTRSGEGQEGCPDRAVFEGRSWTPLLADRTRSVRGEQDVVAKELFFRRSVRQGDMKAVYQPTHFAMFGPLTKPGETKWQLYDLAADLGETHDLAAERPDVLKVLTAQWYAYADRNNVIVPAGEEKSQDTGSTR